MMTLCPSIAAMCPVRVGATGPELKRLGSIEATILPASSSMRCPMSLLTNCSLLYEPHGPAGEPAGVPGRARARLLVGEALNDLSGSRVDHAHGDLDRHTMRVDAAGGRRVRPRQEASGICAALPGLIELQNVSGHEIARAGHLARRDRGLRIDLAARRQLMFAQRRAEVRAIQHVEAAVVDHPVGEQIAQRHARLERAVPARGEAVRAEVQDGDRWDARRLAARERWPASTPTRRRHMPKTNVDTRYFSSSERLREAPPLCHNRARQGRGMPRGGLKQGPPCAGDSR